MMRILAWMSAVALLVAAPTAPAEAPGAQDTVARSQPLPITIDNVWYRSTGDRTRGDLVVADDGLEVLLPRRTVFIPVERIQYASLGKMRGDVDTDWIVMAIGVSPPYDVIGIRDGRKMGFGRKTEELYQKLRAALRHIPAAQWATAEGYQAYEDPAHQYALALPDDWYSFDKSMVYSNDEPLWGSTVFSEEPLRRIEESADGRIRTTENERAVERALAGDARAFFVERMEAGRGMSCKEFSASARKKLAGIALDDPRLGQGYELAQPTADAGTAVGGCDAFRLAGGNGERQVELVFVANRETLFVFGVRAAPERFAAAREPFDAALASAKFSVAL